MPQMTVEERTTLAKQMRADGVDLGDISKLLRRSLSWVEKATAGETVPRLRIPKGYKPVASSETPRIRDGRDLGDALAWWRGA